jgi:hypothetical protein
MKKRVKTVSGTEATSVLTTRVRVDSISTSVPLEEREYIEVRVGYGEKLRLHNAVCRLYDLPDRIERKRRA